jgi:hypothetical protein
VIRTEERRCILQSEQYSQGYRVPCSVAQLAERSPYHQATYWHNRMFNPNLPERVEILSFRPDWRHARAIEATPANRTSRIRL